MFQCHSHTRTEYCIWRHDSLIDQVKRHAGRATRVTDREHQLVIQNCETIVQTDEQLHATLEQPLSSKLALAESGQMKTHWELFCVKKGFNCVAQKQTC